MNLGPGKVLRELKECGHLHIVSVIASFDCDRNIKPLYIRVGNESLKVLNAVHMDTTSSIITYRCEVADGEFLKTLKVSYFTNESLWAIVLQ